MVWEIGVSKMMPLTMKQSRPLFWKQAFAQQGKRLFGELSPSWSDCWCPDSSQPMWIIDFLPSIVVEWLHGAHLFPNHMVNVASGWLSLRCMQ
jgi:hypothetical protein